MQLPTGDENDWLGTEPDIDEAAITETWDTDIVIVGAGNGGMCAAAYAAQNGLDFPPDRTEFFRHGDPSLVRHH